MDNNAKLIREMLKRADMRLAAQLQLATAADARAMHFMALCIAAASLSVAMAGKTSTLAVFVIAGMLIVAAVCSFWAARPVGWYAPGSLPSDFDEDIADSVPLFSVERELAYHLEHCIKSNSDILSGNAKALKLGAICAMLAPFCGGIVYLFDAG